MMNTPLPNTAAQTFKPATAVGLLIVHLLALLAVFPQFFSWWGFGLFLLLTWATASLGVSLCFHRLLTHCSYRTVPWLRNTLTFLACLSLQDGPILWSATHRLHHRESDHEDDPHSPLVSFWWAHIGWTLYHHKSLNDPQSVRKLVPDLYDDKALQFFDRYFVWLWIAFALLTFGIGFAFGGFNLGMSLLIWGSFVRTVLVWHNTWFVNSATHMWGYRNYRTTDDSRNLWWVALLTFGEGWHNNHHALAGSATFSHRWWEFDATYLALVVFRSLGWVQKVNVVPQLRENGPSRSFTGKTAAMSKALKSALRIRETAGAID